MFQLQTTPIFSLCLQPTKSKKSRKREKKKAKKEPRRRIVAMKGHPCTGKSRIAWLIADTFDYSYISVEDISASLVQLQAASSTSLADELSYEAACRIASTYLQQGSDVVIDCSISSRTHVDHLLRLSEISGAKLVVVECKPKDVYEWQRSLQGRSENGVSGGGGDQFLQSLAWDDLQVLTKRHGYYDDGDIPKLIIDTTTELSALFLHFGVIALYECPIVHHLDFQEWRAGGFKRLINDKSLMKTERKREEKDMHDTGHLHELTIFDGSSKDDEEKTCSCSKCLKPISSSAYACRDCKFFLHKSCAESPNKVDIGLHDDLPFLEPLADLYSFPETFSCSSKVPFSFLCSTCLYMTQMKCGFFPCVVRHGCHEHLLMLRIHLLHSRVGFQCQACGEMGSHVGYCCTKCNFYVHVNCAFLPITSEHRNHRHVLKLNSSSSPQGGTDEEFYCDICESKRNYNNWMYYCEECDYASHLECATSQR